MKNSFLKRASVILGLGLPGFFIASTLIVHADTVSVNFEPPAYSVGSISGQNGWSNAVNPSIDQGVVTTTVAGFGTQAFRMSNAYTSGSFGDWVFAPPLTDAVGEPSSTDGGFSPGTLQPYFTMQFQIASADPTEQQPGLQVSVAPDRGDGSRMSYLRFEDATSGINVFFDDVTSSGTPNSDVFNEYQIASGLDRSVPHTVELTLQSVPGPSNDIVNVYIDGNLVHTGTSWEDYYLYDSEAANEQSPRIIKTMIIQARDGSGTATSTLGKGFLFDNIELTSGPVPTPPPATYTVTIDKFVDGEMANATSAAGVAFPMVATWNATNIGAGTGSYTLSSTGFNSPNPYEAITSAMTSGASYTTSEVTSSTLVGTSCASGDPYALVGYSTGTSSAVAASGTVSMTIPNFSDLTSNEYVVVWNKNCLAAPTLLSPANGTATTTAGLTSVSWNSVTDPAGGVTYVYQSANSSSTNSDGSFTSPAYTSGALTTTTIATPGTPAGVYFWHVQATDADGNVSPWSTVWMFTVNNSSTVVTPPPATSTPRSVKTAVLAGIVAYENTITNKQDKSDLNEAAICVQNSLNSKWWIDDSHVVATRAKGGEVFFNEECSALFLKDLLNDHKGTISTSTVQGFINSLVSDDRVLATTEIAAATAAHGKSVDLTNAAYELNEADHFAATKDPVDAIDHYEPAWEWALRSLGYSF